MAPICKKIPGIPRIFRNPNKMTEPTTPNLKTLHRCINCGELKPLNEFPRDASKKLGHRTICKTCHYNKRAKETNVTAPYPNDPLRVNPKHKQYISESGVYIYSDTCATCKHYSAFYGGCRIRESSNNQSVVKRASVPMSVSAGAKCKMWVKK
jgi:hypothetical protein